MDNPTNLGITRTYMHMSQIILYYRQVFSGLDPSDCHRTPVQKPSPSKFLQLQSQQP